MTGVEACQSEDGTVLPGETERHGTGRCRVIERAAPGVEADS